jgi:hypothetical protein
MEWIISFLGVYYLHDTILLYQVFLSLGSPDGILGSYGAKNLNV